MRLGSMNDDQQEEELSYPGLGEIQILGEGMKGFGRPKSPNCLFGFLTITPCGEGFPLEARAEKPSNGKRQANIGTQPLPIAT